MKKFFFSVALLFITFISVIMCYANTSSFEYIDFDSGISFVVPKNWSLNYNYDKAIAFDHDLSEEFILCWSEDYWSSLSDEERSERGFQKRADINNDAFSYSDISTLFETKNKYITTQTYNGIKYFKIDGKFDTGEPNTLFVCFINGWQYTFGFSNSMDSKYAGDMKQLLNSVSYPTISKPTVNKYEPNKDNPSKEVTINNQAIEEYERAMSYTTVLIILIFAIIIVLAILLLRKIIRRKVISNPKSRNTTEKIILIGLSVFCIGFFVISILGFQYVFEPDIDSFFVADIELFLLWGVSVFSNHIRFFISPKWKRKRAYEKTLIVILLILSILSLSFIPLLFYGFDGYIIDEALAPWTIGLIAFSFILISTSAILLFDKKPNKDILKEENVSEKLDEDPHGIDKIPCLFFCRMCGAKIPNDSVFCPNCGNQIKNS